MREVDLIQKVQEGDLQAFEQLFEMYKISALRMVYLMTRNRDISEDILQEAFVTCYTTIKSLRNREYFKTWFYKILTRTTWSYMKKEKRLIPTENIIDLVEEHSKNTWEQHSQKIQVEQTIAEAINTLEPKCRAVVILYYYNDFSIKEVAKVMGCLEGTVKSRLYTARNRLKINLLEENKVKKEALSYEAR